MAIRPIDMSITVQRVTELNRSNTGENARPDTQHQMFADRLNREAHLQQQTVHQTGKGENNNVNPDEKGGSKYSGKKNKKKDEKENAVKRQAIKDSIFDYSI